MSGFGACDEGSAASGGWLRGRETGAGSSKRKGRGIEVREIRRRRTSAARSSSATPKPQYPPPLQVPLNPGPMATLNAGVLCETTEVVGFVKYGLMRRGAREGLLTASHCV